jgi:hypothetical protein
LDNKHLDEESFGTLIDSKLKASVNWYETKISEERQRVIQYYNGEKPDRQSKGSSSFVTSEVYDSVEAMKAQLLETFSAGRDIVKFDPAGPQDVEDARIQTRYCDHVVFSQNDGHAIFGEVIHDALIARVGVVKVYWDECKDRVEEEFSGLTEQDVQGLAQLEQIESLTGNQGEDGLYSGKLVRVEDKSQVRIEVLNPEEFAIEPQARALSPDYFCVHYKAKTIEELVKDGFPKKKIMDAAGEVDDALNQRPEVISRFSQLDSGFASSGDSDTQDEMRKLVLNECYVKAKLEGDDYAKLYKVLRLGTKNLSVEEVDDLPFVAFVPLPVPHSFYGNNFAARVMPAQNIATMLMRSVVDHTAITNNPRYQVLKGGVTNPRELLDNRLGGLINVTRENAVVPLPQAPLNPYVFQVMELNKARNEETTGISSLSQGLNKDAISKQNSQGMVNDLVNLSQTRQKVIARNFALGFLVPLFLKVQRLVTMREKRSRIIETAGNWQTVNFERWKERSAATPSLHLGYGEVDREVQKRQAVFQSLAGDPHLANMFTDMNRYKFATDTLRVMGYQNVNDYLTPPDKLPPPQPDPFKVQEMQIKQQQAQAQLLTAQAAQKKVDMHGAIEQMKATLQQHQQKIDNMLKIKDENRKDADIANKIDVSQREVKIVEETPVDTETASVSPRG